MAEDGRQVHGGPDDSAIFETYHQADDVLYIGSDDEHYESPSHRLQRCRDRYNAFNEKGWRVPPVLVTARLKGPFSSDVWENPWRSRSAVPTKIGRRSKTATTARVTKPLQDSAPTKSKARPVPGAGSVLGPVPDTTTNIIKPKMASKPAARRFFAPAQEPISGLSSAGSVFATGGEPASRRNPRKRGGPSTDWLRRVSSPKRPRSGSREEPFASSPTDKVAHKRPTVVPSESSAADSGSIQAPAQAQPLQPLQGMLESHLFPDEDALIEDSFVIDEDSMAHTPIHPSRFQPEHPTLMASELARLAPPQKDTAMPAICERFLAAFNESHSASPADTGPAANDKVVGSNKDTAQAGVPGVPGAPRPDTRFETHQDDSFCYQAKARLPNAWTASGIPHYNTEIRDEELQREQVSVPSLMTTDQPNTEQSTQNLSADESSWAGFESDSESPAITNAAPSPLADMETTSVEAHPDEDSIPALFSTVKAKTLALSPAKAPVSEPAIKITSATGDETLIPEHGCTTTFGSEETTLLAEADTDHAPPFFFQLKESSAGPGTEEPVTSAARWSLHPASSRSVLTPTPPQAAEETIVRLPQFSPQHSHQPLSESLILLPQSSAEMEAIQARFAVSGLPQPEAHEVAIEGLDGPTQPLLLGTHASAVGAPNEDDVWDGKVEHDDSHRASYPPDTGRHLPSDTSYPGARLATQDQSPWAAPPAAQPHAPLPSSPMIKPLTEPAPANLPPMHPLYAPTPTMQGPWARVDLQAPCLPVNGAVSPLSLSFALGDDEVPNPALPSFDNIQQDKNNTLPLNGRPSTPEDKLSSLPTPDLSVSNKPFRRFLSPSPRSKRRYGGFGNAEMITFDGLPQATPDVIDDMVSNPWLQHQRPAKRVRFAPLPGEKVEDQQDSTKACSPSCSALSDPLSSSEDEGDGDEDYIEAGLPQQKSQSVARAKKVAALATAGSAPPQPAPARPCSPPPPSRTAAEDLPSEVTLFRNHFAKMQGKQHCLTPRPTFTRLFADKVHASPSSQAADAAAERFVDADRRRDDTSNAAFGRGSGASGGILKLQSALKTSNVSHDDGVDDVSAVINNLGDFLGSWDLDSELAKATAEKERDRDAETRLNPFSIPMDIGQWS